MKSTRNAMILKVLNEMTKGKEVTVENLDSLKDIFNEQLDPAIAESSIVITNQSGFNYLDKLKDKDGNYILQKDPTQQTKGKMLFGEYRIVKLSKKTLKSTPIMNSDGHTIDGYKHPVFCGDLKEAITLFDRNVLTIDLNDKGAGLWDKDMTGLKVRDRFDVQAVDKDAVINREPFSKSTRCHVSHGIADAVSRLAIVRASVAIRTLTGRLLPRFGFYLL